MSETLSNGVSEQNQEQKKVKNNGESKAFKVKGKPKSYYVKRALGDYCKAMAEFEVVRKLGYIMMLNLKSYKMVLLPISKK